MRLILKDCLKHNKLSFWIGDDLTGSAPSAHSNSAVIAMPYRINQHPIGAVGLLGPVRMPYRTLFETVQQFSDHVSAALTKNLYKFKISLKQPKQHVIDLERQDLKLIGKTEKLLLEDKRILKKRESKPRRKKS